MRIEPDSWRDLGRLPEPPPPEGFLDSVMARTAEVERERSAVAAGARDAAPERSPLRVGVRVAATGIGLGAGVAAEVFVLWNRGWEWVPGWVRPFADSISEVRLPTADLSALVLAAGLGAYLLALLAGLEPERGRGRGRTVHSE